MFQNGQAHSKNVAANAAGFVRCVRPFWEVMYEKINLKT